MNEKTAAIPRPEYPRPQFVRDSWINLNGVWSYEFDFGRSGLERGLEKSKGFASRIKVPFCPESRLSGVAYTDFIESMFYHRVIQIPAAWCGKKIFLNFGAVDFIAQIYIDGTFVLRHVGGSSSFQADITSFVSDGKTHDLVVAVTDLTRSGHQGGGKQSSAWRSAGCSYTRVTGIWQTVWMECADVCGLSSCRITPDLDGGSFSFLPEFYSEKRGKCFNITILDKDRIVAEKTIAAVSGIPVVLPVPDVKVWSPENPFLYDIVYTVTDADGTVLDSVKSYAGMRKIHIENNRLFLNNREVFLRFVLDQGFYPEGIWTAPDDDALKHDIEMSMACGFNGARLHQKIFEERFHYWADRLGYLTWGEFPTWGLASSRNDGRFNPGDSAIAQLNYLREWESIVVRDFSHPSIIAWTPYNETSPKDPTIYSDDMTFLYDLTKKLDPTRPVNDSSGWYHVKTDLWTVHFYAKDAEDLDHRFRSEGGTVARQFPEKEVVYAGQPYLNDEFGGFKFIPADRTVFADNSWGYYGMQIRTPEELVARIREQVDYMLEKEDLSGFCYTQLTDVEQEENGLFCYDRTPKAPVEQFAEVFGRNPKRIS